MYIPQEIYQFVAQNKIWIRSIYSVFISLICLIIVLKTDKLFRVSSHQGIRYFRNAFFFYFVAFLFRGFLSIPAYFTPAKFLFEFFMIMGGFSLVYSLLWKKLETKKDAYSLFNSQVLILYGLALIIATLDILWKGYNFMFLSQIILFLFASILSYKNYQRNGKKHKFLRLYFGVMILNFVIWVMNFIFINYLGGRLRWLTNIYALNVLIFIIFLYGVIKFTRK